MMLHEGSNILGQELLHGRSIGTEAHQPTYAPRIFAKVVAQVFDTQTNLAYVPGIRVVVPAFADDAAGLLRTAMRSRGTTVYLEPKFLYNAKMAQAVIPPDFAVPFGKARVRREGTMAMSSNPYAWRADL